MAASLSTLPWIWVIEALASFKQVDASALIDMVKRTPEISDDLGKNAREMVSLRILETFFTRQFGSSKGSSAPDSRIELDPSEHCEDVVRRIVHEMSASNLRTDEPEMLKWDVQTFIMRKRACLPKCTLQQLKEAILGGNHPILAPLKERSGLSISNQSESRMPPDDGDLNAIAGRLERSCSDAQIMSAGGNLPSPTHEKLEGLLQEDTTNRDLLPSKRDRSDLDTEELAANSHEDRISIDSGCDPHLHNAKKLKLDATFTSQAPGQKAVSTIGNGLSEDLISSNGLHTVRDGSDLAKLSQVGGLGENMFSEDGYDQHISLTRTGNDAEDAGLQHNNPQMTCDNNKVPQDTSADGPQQDLPVNEAKDDDEHCAETGTSDVAPLDGTHQSICGHEAREKCEKSQLNTSNGAPLDGSYQNNFPDDAKDGMEHNPRKEMSSDSDGYRDEKIDVAAKKRTFLSSQCTFSQESLATADYTELNLCMKCNKGGQLLVCSASACLLVVHQSCLGSAPSFDDNGNFYCPFCAYSHAISEYLEVKKKASLARKDLAVFIGLENEHQANKLAKRFLRPEQNQLLQDENVNRNDRTNYDENYVNEVNSSQYMGNKEDKQQVEPSVSCVNENLPCEEEGATTNGGPLPALMEGEKDGETLVPQCQAASELKEQQSEEQAGCSRRDDNSTCRDREIVHSTKRHVEDVMQKEVLQPPTTDSTPKAAHLPTIDAEGSSEEENDMVTSNYSITLRRREKREKQEKQFSYPAIPQLRRKKVSWTSSEEEILKEGLRRFSSVNDRIIPWKRILEFGSNVFQKGRTTIDLKDKWRNICKGSPKSK